MSNVAPLRPVRVIGTADKAGQVAPSREFVRWLEQQTIAVGGAAVWGGISGNITAQTDLIALFTAVDADIAGLTADLAATDGSVTSLTAVVATKQATLVSGTNIKTVNGNSLLGSGNLVIAGGGGDTGSIGFDDNEGVFIMDEGLL